MSVDWKLLSQVRECHKVLAQEHVVRQRDAAEQHAAELRQAEVRLQAQHAAKTQLWQSTINDPPGGFSVDQLRHASVWSRALDSRIAQAGDTVREAEQQAAQQRLRLDASRQQLRAAAGDLEKAERMRLRHCAEQRRRLDLRQEVATEEAAAQRWNACKAP